jgi:cytokinin dehydrogenase
MPDPIGRRSFLVPGLASVAIVAFDPFRRSWVTAAEAADGAGAPRGLLPVPAFHGQLVTDPTALAEASDDYGHIVHRRPLAVLLPGSVRDVAAVVRYANRHRLTVAMRGRGHATFGQAQADAGIVIDSRTLAAIHRISPAGAVVDAGVQWLDLLQATLEHGLTPPVLTDYLELSVGGTLSVGGIGGTTHQHGLQVDNVVELLVVTGDGKLRRCSPTRDRFLFQAVLGGLGQVAIIVRATIRLVPAPSTARVYQLSYSDAATFTSDQRRVVAERRFSYLEGQVVDAEDGTWSFLLEAAAYYTPPAVPDDAALLHGLTPDVGGVVVDDLPYFDWINRLAPVVELLKQLGLWDLPHPWFNVFLPATRTVGYVEEVLADLTLDDTGQGPILLYPFGADRVTQPFVQLPAERIAFLFAILRTAIPPADAPVDGVVQRELADNRALFERARAIGGKQYPVGSIPFSHADWVAHFGPDYPAFLAAKSRFDPRRVLTPGQGIFTPG